MSTEPVARIIQSEFAPGLITLSREQETQCVNMMLVSTSVITESGQLWDQKLGTFLYFRNNPTMSNSLTAPIEDVLKRLMSFQVKIPDSSDVRAFLLSHSILLVGLEEICLRAYRVFGANSQLALEVSHDPEIDWQELVLYVRRQEYAPGIMDEIDQFYESCGVHLMGLSGSLLISTDFQPPI